MHCWNKVLSLLWLANHCQMMSVVRWKLTVKSQNDCYFVLGWWVQCYVLCQQWCCACWSWWNTESYEACCCTGNTQRGSVSCTFRKFSGMGNAWCLQSRVKAHFSCGSVSYSRHIFQLTTNATGSCSSYIIYRCFSSCMQCVDWKWLKIL